MPDGESGRDFVTALARGLEVIQAFGADAPEMTLSEIARRTSMSAATVRRSLITLAQLGYVRRHERRFLLGPKVLTLGASYLESMNLKELAQHHLVELVERFHDAASLTVLDNFEVVYIAHVPSDQRVRHGRSVGSRLPAHATSTGIVLLAHASDEHRRLTPSARRSWRETCAPAWPRRWTTTLPSRATRSNTERSLLPCRCATGKAGSWRPSTAPARPRSSTRRRSSRPAWRHYALRPERSERC
jgi:DNA-binding IclR family transcriptional regulator